MADGTPDSVAVTQSTEQEPSPSSSVELKYPTINLRTSYESLLSNSTISTKRTLTMTRSQQPAMDESWAALQPSDYTNDDDQQSDIVDTGSLVDLSSTHDTESIMGDDTPSEPDLEREEGDVISQSLAQKEVNMAQSQVHGDDLVEDTIILQKSEVQPYKGSIDMEYTIHSTSDSHIDGSYHNLKAQITMTVSTSLLDKKGKPFHVAYYGSPEDSDMKEELLGKIGAAIVLPKALDDSTSSLYNIVPTEFGPGSKPTFAGLMPSHAQMSVEDVRLISTELENLRIVSKKGVVFDSATKNSSDWRPDLFVIHIDRYVTPEDDFMVNKIIKFTEIHSWPTMIVTRDVTGGRCSQAPGSITRLHEVDENGILTKNSQAIDLESLVVIDTEQINRHLKFLTDRSKAHSSKIGLFSSVQRLWKSVQDRVVSNKQASHAAHPVHRERKCNADVATPLSQQYQEQADAASQHILDNQEQLDASADTFPKPRQEAKQGILSRIKTTLNVIASRQTLKDTILSFAVLILGLYIVRFSQGFAQSAAAGLQLNVSTTIPATHSVAQVTTSVLVAPELPSEVPSIDQDVMIYEPISFDQVWSRLTGKSQDAEEKKVTDESQGKEPASRDETTAKDDTTVKDTPKTVTNSLMNMLNSSRNALDRLMDRLEAKVARLEAGMQLKKEQQAQIEEMNQKILDFWAEIPQSLRLASKHSHERYQELVRKSQKHIRRARWATDKRMEELVKEQKKLLSRAQLQAQLLTRDMPRRKRGGIFRKGGAKHGFWR